MIMQQNRQQDSGIIVQHLSVSFPAKTGMANVLRRADISFFPGRITALVGESGSGKSIFGAAIMRLLPPTACVQGSVRFDGKELLILPEAELNEIRGRQIAWIYQDPVTAMDPRIRVGEQVTEALTFFGNLAGEDRVRNGTKQLADFGLSDPAQVYRKYPHELSGGMAQRVLTAMMTMPNPAWVIADEPTKGLDAFVRSQVSEMFRTLRDRGTGFILITHDLQLAKRVADSLVILYAGEIVETGAVRHIFGRPLHPYTQGLLAAQPGEGMQPIPGVSPNMSDLPEGCIFAERCPFHNRACTERPRLREAEPGHFVSCCRAIRKTAGKGIIP